MRRYIPLLSFVFLLAAAGVGAGESASPPAVSAVDGPRAASAEDKAFGWDGLAGWREEMEAEELELRDEIIAADLTFMAALEKAAEEARSMDSDDPRHALAWARVEYLAEAAYHLLEDSGEYEAFLKATAGLTPDEIPPAEPVSFDEADGGPRDEDGGLHFETESGKRLLPTLIDGRTELVDAESAEVIGPDVRVIAGAGEVFPAPNVSVHLVKMHVAWLRARSFERIGRVAEAGREIARLGTLDQWYLIGPLDRDIEALSALGIRSGDLLESLDPDFQVAGKNGPARWRPFSSLDPLGRLNAGAAFGNDEPAMAYGLTLVYSPVNQPAVVHFGSTGPATVRVNNSPNHESLSMGLAMPGQDVFDVWLRRGWNLVTVKTLSAIGSWRLAMSLAKPDGTPLLCYSAPATRKNLAKVFAEARDVVRRSAADRHYRPGRESERGGLSALSRRLAEDPNDARANFYLAAILSARRLMEGAERFDRELIFRRAIELSGGDPYFFLMAARTAEAGVEGPDREENLRLLLLKLAAEKGSAAAMVDIGRLYLDVMRQPRRAGDYAERAAEANPMSLRAGVLAHDVAVARGWPQLASSLLERLRQRHPSAGAVRLRAGRAALARGRFRTALSEFHALMGINADSDEALRGAVRAFGMLGQNSAAVELLKVRLERFPYDTDARGELARLYRDLGRDAEALEVAGAALAINPDDRAARALLRDLAPPRDVPSELSPHPSGFLSPYDERVWDAPAATPAEGWEYLYFQVEDRMQRNGSIDRRVSFAMRIYTDHAAEALRHLDFNLEEGLESGLIDKLTVIRSDGRREELFPDAKLQTRSGLSFRLPSLSPGMTVLVEVAIHRGRIPFLGDYFGQIVPLGQPAAVRLSRYMFTAPGDRRLFFRPANGAPQAMMVESAETVTRIWEMNDLPAYAEEAFGPGRNGVMPAVQISSFADWDEFARWYWRLVGIQYHTPPELRLLAQRLAGDEAKEPLEQLDGAAAWMAENLGNREWEFGPYAFRPISVRAILSRRAADGKDRTLLLCLLAQEYGLEAWPALARTWETWRPLPGLDDLSLPLLDHFNYSLAAVDAGDGGQVFLDASNQNRPPGVMPAYLFGAPAMLLTPDGAERLVIPDAGVAGCLWEEEADMTVDPDGGVLWEERVKGSGTAAEALRSRFGDSDRRDAAWEVFLSGVGAQTSTVSAEFVQAPDSPAVASFNGRARIRQLASTDGARVFVEVPPLPGRTSRTYGGFEYPLSLEFLSRMGERTQDLLVPSAFKVSRRLSVNYPPEWKPVNRTNSFREQYPFGSIEVAVVASSGILEYSFTFEMTERRIAAADYPAFRRAASIATRCLRPLIVWEKP